MPINFDQFLAGRELAATKRKEDEEAQLAFVKARKEAKRFIISEIDRTNRLPQPGAGPKETRAQQAYKARIQLADWEKRYKAGTLGLPVIRGRDVGAIRKAGATHKALAAQAKESAAQSEKLEGRAFELQKLFLTHSNALKRQAVGEFYIRERADLKYKRDTDIRELDFTLKEQDRQKKQYDINQQNLPLSKQDATIAEQMKEQAGLIRDYGFEAAKKGFEIGTKGLDLEIANETARLDREHKADVQALEDEQKLSPASIMRARPDWTHVGDMRQFFVNKGLRGADLNTTVIQQARKFGVKKSAFDELNPDDISSWTNFLNAPMPAPIDPAHDQEILRLGSVEAVRETAIKAAEQALAETGIPISEEEIQRRIERAEYLFGADSGRGGILSFFGF